MRKIIVVLMLSYLIGLCQGQARKQFQNCVESNCDAYQQQCQNKSEQCLNEIKKFTQCQSTADICNNQKVAEENFINQMHDCINYCELTDSSSEFQDYFSCVQSCFSHKLASLSIALLVIISQFLL